MLGNVFGEEAKAYNAETVRSKLESRIERLIRKIKKLEKRAKCWVIYFWVK